MAFSISGLIENINDSISNLLNKDQGNSSERAFYPELATVQSTINPANWITLPFPYSFDVYNGAKKSFGTTPFGEFTLPIAPQKLNQNEKFAINITKTQGGAVVNHSGALYKTLTLSGTTGLAPFKGTAGANKSTGEAIFQPDELKYQSGFKVFHMLRNYFNTYYQYKKDFSNDPDVQKYRLVFKNYKDGQFLIIELLSFKLQRTAEQSFLYNYEIECEVLKQLDFAEDSEEFSKLELFEKNLTKVVQKIDFARGVFLRSQEILRQVEATYDQTILEPLRKISLATKAFVGIPMTAADMGNRIIKKTINEASALNIIKQLKDAKREYEQSGGGSEIIGKAKLPSILSTATPATAALKAESIINLNEVLFELPSTTFPEASQNELQTEQLNAQELPKSFYQDTITELTRIRLNMEDFFNVGSAAYDELFNRITTINTEATGELTIEQIDILQAFSDSVSAIRAILSANLQFKLTYDQKIANFLELFDNELDLQVQSAVRELILTAQVSLEDIAQLYLADRNRWPELVELNNLNPPFITQDTTSTKEGVLKPGDKILIPQPSIYGFSEIAQLDDTRGVSQVLKSFGIDFKISENFDLVFSNGGDTDLTYYLDNLIQSILLKFKFQKGEIKNAPRIGVNLNVGEKVINAIELKNDIVQTVLQDPRVEKISNIAIYQKNNVIKLLFKVKPKNTDVPVPIEVNF